MTNQQWVREATGASLRSLGERLGLNHVTVGRRIDDGDANTCIAIARAYGQDPIEWLVGWGILTADEAKNGGVAEALRDATQLQLAEELVSRIKAAGADEDIDAPLAETHPLMSADQPGPLDVDVLAGVTQEDYDLAAGNAGDIEDDADDEIEFP